MAGQSFLRRKGDLTGVIVLVTGHSNTAYVQMVRRSIYETRRHKHPHLPIRQYKRRPQGPSSWPRYTWGYVLGTQYMHLIIERYLVRVGEEHVEEASENLPRPHQIYSKWHCETLHIWHSPVCWARPWDARPSQVLAPTFDEGQRVRFSWLVRQQQII